MPSAAPFSVRKVLLDPFQKRGKVRTEICTIKSITEELLAEGYLEQKFWNGYSRTFLTEKGEALGIRAEERESQNGNLYDVFLYGEKAQQYVVELLKRNTTAD